MDGNGTSAAGFAVSPLATVVVAGAPEKCFPIWVSRKNIQKIRTSLARFGRKIGQYHGRTWVTRAESTQYRWFMICAVDGKA